MSPGSCRRCARAASRGRHSLCIRSHLPWVSSGGTCRSWVCLVKQQRVGTVTPRSKLCPSAQYSECHVHAPLKDLPRGPPSLLSLWLSPHTADKSDQITHLKRKWSTGGQVSGKEGLKGMRARMHWGGEDSVLEGSSCSVHALLTSASLTVRIFCRTTLVTWLSGRLVWHRAQRVKHLRINAT